MKQKKRSLLIAAVIIVLSFGFGYGIGCVIAYFTKDSKEMKPVIENGTLTPEAMLTLGRLSDPQLSPDGTRIIYNVSRADMKNNKFVRSLYICNADGSEVKQIASSKGVTNARWSKDGKRLYFIADGQIRKARLVGSKLLFKSKLSDIPSGVSEFKISPDFTKLIYITTIKNRFVDQPQDIAEDLDKAQAYATEDLMYRHWDHWVTETPRSLVASLDSKITAENSTDILGDEPWELPTEPFGGAEQLSWSPDSRYIAYSCRKLKGIEYAFSTNTCIYIYDTETCTTVPVTTAGGYDTDPSWSPDGTALAWISMERDGYEADRQRIMLSGISVAEDKIIPGEPRELTKDFQYDAAGIMWSEDGKKIIFPCTMDAIGALCELSIDEPGVVRLTPDDWWFAFGAPFAKRGETLLTTYQSMDFPSEIVSVDLSGRNYTQISHINDDIIGQLDSIRCEEINLPTPQGVTLHCWVLYPPHFDPSVKTPGVEMFNGGPQSSLDQTWSYRWNFRLMAQQGYVVVLPNRHGDSGFGQSWKEQISGDYQGLNMEDYKIAARWFREQPWAGKLAGVGASYGGFSVYNMMGIHGDLFDCFISHAGIFSERAMWYTTEESWFANWDGGGLTPYAYEAGKTGPQGDGITFGGMQQAGAPYAVGAKPAEHYGLEPETRVTSWHTPILCMHGMMDFRIPYTQGMAAFNAAKMMGVPARLVMFPEECHWILQPQNALLWHREFYGWLDKWLR